MAGSALFLAVLLAGCSPRTGYRESQNRADVLEPEELEGMALNSNDLGRGDTGRADTGKVISNAESPDLVPSTAAALREETKTDIHRLAELWKERRAQGISDFPIGPGDLLEISVPAIPELASRSEKVDGDGTIALPYIGEIKAAGLTDDEFEEALRVRLQKYMYNPRVFVFVREYRSRQVAVLGAVGQPGTYTLASESDTLFDLITRAGGMRANADPLIQLIPAVPVQKEKKVEAVQVASVLPINVVKNDPAPLILKRSEPILIDLRELTNSGSQQYLYLPVRPGDIIMVPGGGEVLVEGWVEKPGAYGLNPGMTLSGVIAAAGGPLYPADVEAVKLIRPRKNGKKTIVTVSLDQIKSGAIKDIRLQGGDIVDVAATNSKLIPYGAYKFFTTIIKIGVGGNIPIF